MCCILGLKGFAVLHVHNYNSELTQQDWRGKKTANLMSQV